ncbi:MAG: hypothetical protein JW704_13890 [Anaerolineaceae bacterium]|nr:hypothetical protein [Anaerolineaceae bacterium]MBN2677746.1 hypothetical protein [Anaerolineaceae bacterium]
MKKHSGIFLTIILLALAALACTLPSISNIVGSTDQTETDGGVLFSDDFSNKDSGWDRYTDTDVITDYGNGIYRIYISVTNWDYWANPGKNFTDVRVEVDATKAGGPDDNDIGVICRYKSTNDFYFFLISSDGYYGIGKTVGGEMQLIGQDELYSSDDINLGSDTNHIRADCVGPRLSLYVNGILLSSVTDSDFSNGDVGLMAGTYDTPGADIHFDDFVVYDPAVKK